MNFDTLLNLAKAAAPAIPFGGAAVVVAKSVVKLIDEFKDKGAATATQTASLDQEREQLEAAVHAHAKRTADSLKG